MTFALASATAFMAMGAGFDLSRAFSARQRLSEAAALTCQYSVRSSVLQSVLSTAGVTGSFQTYLTSVNSFASSALANQRLAGVTATPTGSGFFTASAPASSSSLPTNPSAEFSANVSTSFLRMINVTQIPVHAKINCLTATATAPTPSSPYIMREGFESACAAYCFVAPDGTMSGGAIFTPSSATTSSPGYAGSNGQSWYIHGYCLEIDATGVINASSPEGSHSIELDCDNGSGTRGNSSITTKMYLASGYYELRYFYRSRIVYPNYEPVSVCATTASDLSWANDTTTWGFAAVARTNQVNVYLDQAATSSVPVHTTLDGTQTLGGSNLIDTCVYSSAWTERSVKITITTPANYWLSFAADGASDSYGAQLDNIRFCQVTCPGTPQDNFPVSWLASSNGGINKVLFEDTFDSPYYAGPGYSFNGNMAASTGTTGWSGGWPNQPASGWANAPTNQIPYWNTGCPQGSGCLEFGYGRNDLISRPFLLAPGYYQLKYIYDASVRFAGVSGAYCGATPSAARISSLSSVSAVGTLRVLNAAAGTFVEDTNAIGAFMAHAALTSTPNASAVLGATTSYTNPNGTTTTTPTNAPAAISMTNFNASQSNALLDLCAYSAAAQTRTISIKITKPAFYWLTFAALGSADSYGGVLDDVILTALGSPYMSTPPASPLAIPVPAPQPDASYSNNSAFSGFYIVANPFVAPGASQ